jgi:hypothetical protein
MKTLLITLMLINQSAFAQALPPINPPSGLDEGTETRLSEAQVVELIPWANRSNDKLRQMIRDVSKLRNLNQIKYTLLNGIKNLVLTQTPERTELQMRYVLNRSLKVLEQIEKYASPTTPGILDLEVRILRLSALMAIEYYKDDMKYITGQNKVVPVVTGGPIVKGAPAVSDVTPPLPKEAPDTLVALPFGKFAVEYSDFLMRFNESVFNAKAQYAIGILALGLFQWDLYRDDQKKLLYAPAITKVYEFLRSKSEAPIAMDLVNVQEMRQIRNAYRDAIGTLRAADPNTFNPVFESLEAKHKDRK